MKINGNGGNGKVDEHCTYCGKLLSNGNRTKDHVIPKCRGGQDLTNNLVPACAYCNQQKSDKILVDQIFGNRDRVEQLIATNEILYQKIREVSSEKTLSESQLEKAQLQIAKLKQFKAAAQNKKLGAEILVAMEEQVWQLQAEINRLGGNGGGNGHDEEKIEIEELTLFSAADITN